MRKLALIQAASKKGLERRARELSDDELMSACLGVPVHFLGNTYFKLAPVLLGGVMTTNIFNPGTTTGGVNCTSAPFDKLWVAFTHLQVVNSTSSSKTVSLWIGATGTNAAGDAFWLQGYSVPANNYVSWYGRKRFGQADFLVGGLPGGTANVTIDGEGEIGIGA
jgi:hypothetical protein